MTDNEASLIKMITNLETTIRNSEFAKEKRENYINSLEEINKLQSMRIFELSEKLKEAKEWFIEIAEDNENRSDFEKYLKEVWNYERS
jgi:hypothetical protein